MGIKSIISNLYKGELVYNKDSEMYYEKAQEYYSEEQCMQFDQYFGARDEVSENGASNFFLENVMTFSEVKKYKGIRLADLDEREHKEAVENIISQIHQFEINPVGYEVKKDAVIFCWYVLPFLRAFPDYVILLPDYMEDIVGGDLNDQ